MTAGTFQIDGRKFRVISEEQYQAMRSALQAQAREDARDVAIAQRRLKDPNRKVIPLARFKKELGL